MLSMSVCHDFHHVFTTVTLDHIVTWPWMVPLLLHLLLMVAGSNGSSGVGVFPLYLKIKE
jgi:hypothetical protein